MDKPMWKGTEASRLRASEGWRLIACMSSAVKSPTPVKLWDDWSPGQQHDCDLMCDPYSLRQTRSLTHRNCKVINGCCFRSPNLWWFVMAATENSYSHLPLTKTVFEYAIIFLPQGLCIACSLCLWCLSPMFHPANTCSSFCCQVKFLLFIETIFEFLI